MPQQKTADIFKFHQGDKIHSLLSDAPSWYLTREECAIFGRHLYESNIFIERLSPVTIDTKRQEDSHLLSKFLPDLVIPSEVAYFLHNTLNKLNLPAPYIQESDLIIGDLLNRGYGFYYKDTNHQSVLMDITQGSAPQYFSPTLGWIQRDSAEIQSMIITARQTCQATNGLKEPSADTLHPN